MKKYQHQTLQNYNLGDIFAKSQEKAAKLKQIRLEKEFKNI